MTPTAATARRLVHGRPVATDRRLRAHPTKDRGTPNVHANDVGHRSEMPFAGGAHVSTGSPMDLEGASTRSCPHR